MQKKVDEWIKKFALIPHPEGGYFRETYRSQEIVHRSGLSERYSGDRAHATAIYFLLAGEQVSKFHRLRSDEIWCYHAGSALTLFEIKPDGTLRELLLGPDLDNSEQPQVCIPHGVWFGARVNQEQSFTLVSCIVAPGFDFTDFELATTARLLAEYPQHRNIIERLT